MATSGDFDQAVKNAAAYISSHANIKSIYNAGKLATMVKMLFKKKIALIVISVSIVLILVILLPLIFVSWSFWAKNGFKAESGKKSDTISEEDMDEYIEEQSEKFASDTAASLVENVRDTVSNAIACFPYGSNWYTVFVVAYTKSQLTLSGSDLNIEGAADAVQKNLIGEYLKGLSPYENEENKWESLMDEETLKEYQDKINDPVYMAEYYKQVDEMYAVNFNSFQDSLNKHVKVIPETGECQITSYFPLRSGTPYCFVDGLGEGDYQPDQSIEDSLNSGNLAEQSARIYAPIGSPIILIEKSYIESIGWDGNNGWSITFVSEDQQRKYKYIHLQNYSDIIIGSVTEQDLTKVVTMSTDNKQFFDGGTIIGYLGNSGGKNIGASIDGPTYLGIIVSYLYHDDSSISDELSEKLSVSEFFMSKYFPDDGYTTLFLIEGHKVPDPNTIPSPDVSVSPSTVETTSPTPTSTDTYSSSPT